MVRRQALSRGEIRWAYPKFPDTAQALHHMVVLLRDVHPQENQVPVAICTTDDYPERAPRSFEMKFPKRHYRCFKNPTVIDCRAITFVATIPLYNAIEPEATLTEDEVFRLENCILDALQIQV